MFIQVLGVSGSMPVSKTVGVGSNPAVPAKYFEFKY